MNPVFQRIFDDHNAARERVTKAVALQNPHTGCPDCDGDGRIWNNADPTSGQWVECDACGNAT